MGFGFNLFFIFILIPVTVILLLAWLSTKKIIYGKVVGFTWLGIININAGFDETSVILGKRFMAAELIVLDFYDPLIHTEVSIKRARKAYPAFPGTRNVTSDNLQLEENSADKIFVILSAHEIRNKEERIRFFKELKRLIKPSGQIFIVEHLRDKVNFMAYSIGFLHFYSKSTWFEVFQAAELKIQNEIKITPFISTFILEKNGNTF
ncbi:hypothetical protein AQ505_01325 [Pedobacter sp. PACM 27299]|uniref:class I SAM-dependent methyltransferase n=1 Tax=Pedobacter sp. PACM 27299 TaxID=1727164 RepID=UPI0007058EEE|nr:class I SAM-dependent methyltransferase [Pedobacter sp. PACM 27299]ALL04250.1 hypothetical protein AQ505_01325 [Pedobacter sp. PACM 27299]